MFFSLHCSSYFFLLPLNQAKREKLARNLKYNIVTSEQDVKHLLAGRNIQYSRGRYLDFNQKIFSFQTLPGSNLAAQMDYFKNSFFIKYVLRLLLPVYAPVSLRSTFGPGCFSVLIHSKDIHAVKNIMVIFKRMI